MYELTLTTLSRFGQLSQREAEIAKSAATQGWEGAMKMAVAALPDTIKRLDADSVKRTAPELFKSILKQGWDMAVEKKAAGTMGVSGMLTLKEVKELAHALRGPDLNIDLPDTPPITVHNHPADVVVKYEEE